MSPTMDNHGQYDVSLDAMLLASAQLYPAVLNAAIELDLFKIIGEGNPEGMSPSEIASGLPNPHADTVRRLDRLLCLLASHSVLTSSSRKVDEDGRIERLYALSPIGKYMFPDEDGVSYASVSRLSYHPAYIKVRENIKQVILDEEEDLFKKIHGMSMFEYMKKDPTFETVFHKAMADLSFMHMKQILDNYKGFEGISTLVDVAGGVGQSLKMIVSKYPSIQGINFDLPHVVQHAPSHPGIKHVGGSMFECVPEGDAIMIKATTHNWADDKCIKVLKNCHKSLKKGGKLIVIDLIMPETLNATASDKYVAILDNIMFLQAGGKERTEKELEALGKAAGFSSYRVAARVFSSALGVIEFYK
ncbi:isoliquiritigenin 2'-O-methyltransferase-like [Prosopis cineraria]|uniref:isoliquiritigenin 2'-O-methyltransferase-like n=1 Tax=Prosopis cineraria TaxID=364024 RepID=UPI00240F8336|nr:isoliquiritigenin 2'-O-methyltransferase-like [Prosopis cineraria]